MTRTFYDVLGVSPDATTAEIRAAYRDRLKEVHPDLNDADDAGDETKRLVRARDVLTDDAERERYDRIGHATYVGRSESSVEDGDVSRAATAARRAGWASSDSNDDSTSTDAETGERRRARDRRRREREASQRVGTADSSDDGSKRERDESGGSTPEEDDRGTGTGTASGATDDARTWNAGGGFSVRQRRYHGPRSRRLFESNESLTLLAAAFVLYPVMLFSAVFPPFPLVVNVVVGICTVLLVGYVQSIPEVGVVVFGAWSLATPIAFAFAGVELVSLVGLVALAGTWLPLGLSVLTFSMLQR